MKWWDALLSLFAPCAADVCHEQETNDLIARLKSERARTDRHRRIIEELPAQQYSWEELMDAKRRLDP